MKKYVKQEHITTIFGVIAAAYASGILEGELSREKVIVFLAGLLVAIGYNVPSLDFIKGKKPILEEEIIDTIDISEE